MKPILGIDIGGTKIAYALVDNYYKTSAVKILPTPQKNLLAKIEEIIQAHKPDISGVGIGVPGRVIKNSVVKNLPNIENFKPINLQNYLQKKIHLPIWVENDARAFTLAESILGAGKNFSTVVGITLGTGIGGGIVTNKKLIQGLQGLAGEFGHFIMPDGSYFEHFIRKYGPYKNFHQAKKYLALLVNFVIRSVDPDCIIIGGGWKNVITSEKSLKALLPATKGGEKAVTKIKKARCSNAGIIGATLPLLKKTTQEYKIIET
jgi:predicted NBD/HSP70 family sugar kinase